MIIGDLDPAFLAGLAREVLGAPAAELAEWAIAPVSYRVINRVTAGLYSISGTANDRGDLRPWSIFLKIIQNTGADAASSFNPSTNPGDWNYWQREALVYESNLLRSLPAALHVPRCYAVSRPAADTCWLWMEHILGLPATAWPLERFGPAAARLGQFQGQYAAQPPQPQPAWLSHRWLRAWVPSQPAAAIELVADPAAWQHPLIRSHMPPGSAQAALTLWDERDSLLTIAEQLPQTLCHLDFWPHNLFSRATADGLDQTVLLDWSQTGLGAFGEDIANLVLDSVWMLCVGRDDVKRLEEIALGGYIAGLQQAGWAHDPRLIELGYALTGALRFGLLAGSLLQLIHDESQHDEIARRYGQPFEHVIAQRAAVVSHGLTLASRARRLLAN